MQVGLLLGYTLLLLACRIKGKEILPTTSQACSEDDEVEQTCFVCAQLPVDLGLSDCCTDSTAFEICKICLADISQCLASYLDVIKGDRLFADEMPEPNDNPGRSSDVVSKRFGRLFLGPRPLERPNINEILVSEKRAGILDKPDRAEKRWGTLNMGGRYGTYNLGNLWRHYDYPFIGKRSYLSSEKNEYIPDNLVSGEYESRYPGSSYQKRYGTLHLGKRYGTLLKRYGTLFTSKRYGTLFTSKRHGAQDALSKRYGTLFTGKRHDVKNQKKRYGTLHLGKKRSLPNQEKRYGTLHLGKKWGTLGLGNYRRYSPSKREEESSGAFNHNVNKRYGRLFL